MKRLLAWLELLRAPNLFTAMADPLAGFALCSASGLFSVQTMAAMAASACLYGFGILLNDLCDLEIDRIERPHRPLPSGRIGITPARRAAYLMATLGVLLTGLSGLHRAADTVLELRITPLCVTGLLFASIVLYDRFTKHTSIGPIVMGSCRGLNGLLGMAVAGPLQPDVRLVAPIALAVYVASFTSFGRREVQGTRPSRLIAPGAGIVLSILALGFLTAWRAADEMLVLVLWLAMLIHMSRMILRTMRRPDAGTIQYAMRTFIPGIIVFDAVIASAAQGWIGAAAVLILLIPTWLLAQRLDST